MLRLAALFRMAPHEVASWPAAELDLLEEFLAREPPVDVRIEIALARLTQHVVLAWSSRKDATVREFMPYLDVWKLAAMAEDPRYSDLDREVMQSLM